MPASKIWLGLIFIFFVLFVGTRLETGCDFSAYLLRFKYFDGSFDSLVSVNEPGFYLLTYVVKKMGYEYVWVNIIGAVIVFYFLIKFAFNHHNPILVVALSFPILIIQLSMSGIRQAIAVAFLMAALDSFLRGRRMSVALYILLGSTFHQSLIIFLPIALMVGRTFSMWRVIGAIAILLPVALWLLSERFLVYEDRYIEQIYGELSSGGALIRLAVLLVVASLFQLYRRRIKNIYPEKFNIMQLFTLVVFALIPLYLVSSLVVHRMIFYLLPIHLLILASLPIVIGGNKQNTKILELGAIIFYLVYLIGWFSLSRHASICYVPYQSYLL